MAYAKRSVNEYLKLRTGNGGSDFIYILKRAFARKNYAGKSA